jgi:hypothetical protein
MRSDRLNSYQCGASGKCARIRIRKSRFTRCLTGVLKSGAVQPVCEMAVR